MHICGTRGGELIKQAIKQCLWQVERSVAHWILCFCRFRLLTVKTYNGILQPPASGIWPLQLATTTVRTAMKSASSMLDPWHLKRPGALGVTTLYLDALCSYNALVMQWLGHWRYAKSKCLEMVSRERCKIWIRFKLCELVIWWLNLWYLCVVRVLDEVNKLGVNGKGHSILLPMKRRIKSTGTVNSITKSLLLCEMCLEAAYKPRVDQIIIIKNDTINKVTWSFYLFLSNISLWYFTNICKDTDWKFWSITH